MASFLSVSSSSSPYHNHPLLRGKLTATLTNNPTTTTTSPPTTLPIRKIPSDLSLPLLGPLRDRFAYFYTQGRGEYLRSRINRHRSTVLRLNVPPGPPIARDPAVIALLDAVSFPVLFDADLIEKKNLFTGTFMPSLHLTGGYRTLSYIDTTEPEHAPLKKLLFFLLSHRRTHVVPEFRSTFGNLFDSLESDVASAGTADFSEGNDQAAFNFLIRSLFGKDPAESELGTDGPNIVKKWVLFQLGPILTLGLPSLLEDLTLHSIRLPSFLIKKDYDRLVKFFLDSSAGSILDEAYRLGLSKEEAVHNILFSTCFNAYGGMTILFPNVLKWVGRAGSRVQAELAEEIRAAVKAEGGEVTMKAMESMPLMKSVIYECLRIEPPVSLQYGRARKDFIVNSHEAAFEIRAGELLFGYQPFATKDPRVFDRAEEFVADRFVGEEKEKLLSHVLWSNGPENVSPTVGDKQCAGKDFVVLVARMLLVELFLRYDSFDVEVGASALGSSVKLTSLKPASF
uniref:Allene oxide synthase n=1 Tax=Gladiolus hybrid cultivar TaxID=263601 RepID=G3GC09_9ASPA|nr:allene oxide synthase [Gladiolus hybrid cultivar]